MNTLTPKKSLGQHFLKNPRVAESLLVAASVTKDDTVLEIGPGEGFLTSRILKTGARVIAVEADMRSVELLKKSFCSALDSGQLSIIHGDFRDLEIESLPLPKKYSVIANIPYYLTGYIFRKLLTAQHQPRTISVLVQKEIGERIARSKKESLLSLSIKAYGRPEYVQTVSRGNFSPPPKVSSAIIRIADISRENFKGIDDPLFFELLHLGFGSKRKQLLGNLSKTFSKDILIHTFSTLEIPEKIRAEDLPLKIWLKLTYALQIHTKFV